MNKLLLTTALAIGLAASASANTVDWDIDGEFSNNAGGWITSHGNQFKWGVLPSSLTITEFSGPEVYSSNGNYEAHLLNVTWHNATSATLRGQHVDLDIDLDWTSPGSGGGSESYDVAITNTSDFSLCGLFCGLEYDPQDDKIAAMLLDGALDFDGVPLPLDGNVSVVGYEWVLLDGTDGYEDGEGYFSNGYWFNPEHGTSTLALKANVNVVPLPAAGWMLLAGVGGLVAMKRRKKAS